MDVATFRYAAMHPPAGVLRGMPKHKSSRHDREVDNDAIHLLERARIRSHDTIRHHREHPDR